MAGKKDPLDYGKYSSDKRQPTRIPSLQDRALDRYEVIRKKRMDLLSKAQSSGLGKLPIKDVQFPAEMRYENDPVIQEYTASKRRVSQFKALPRGAAPAKPAVPYVEEILVTQPRRAAQAMGKYKALEPRYRSAVGKAVHEAKAAGKPARGQAAEALRLVRRLARKGK